MHRWSRLRTTGRLWRGGFASWCAPSSLEALLPEELGQMIRDLDVVQVRHREVCVPADADRRQLDERHIAAAAIHGVPPLPRHGLEDAPLLLARVRARLLRDVVAVVDDDRDLRELHEVR